MALTTYAALNSRVKAALTDFYLVAVGTTGFGGNEVSLDSYSRIHGGRFPLADELAAPSTATALAYSTHPLWSYPHPTGADFHIPRVRCGHGDPGQYETGILIDRLSHTGGLSGTVTTAQTTNLPTAALPTRETGGEGVMAALQIYTILGNTDTAWTVSYTNQAGTAGRTGKGFFSSTPFVSGIHPIQLEGTDSGVRSVESVTLTSSTLTAGNFGIVLYKPLMMIQPGRYSGSITPTDGGMVGWNIPIDSEAILEIFYNGAMGYNAQTTTLLHYAMF